MEGVDIAVTDTLNRTALLHSVISKHDAITQLLLAHHSELVRDRLSSARTVRCKVRKRTNQPPFSRGLRACVSERSLSKRTIGNLRFEDERPRFDYAPWLFSDHHSQMCVPCPKPRTYVFLPLGTVSNAQLRGGGGGGGGGRDPGTTEDGNKRSSSLRLSRHASGGGGLTSAVSDLQVNTQ